MRKRFLLLLALCLLTILPMAVRAEDVPEGLISAAADWIYPNGAEEVTLLSESPALTEEFCAILHTAAVNRAGSADVSAMEISFTQVENLMQEWMEREPELFYVNRGYNYDYYSDTGFVVNIYLYYLEGMDAAAEAAVEAAVREALSCILPGMDEVQKALVLHDWLARTAEYDYDNYLADTLPPEVYSLYGALVQRSAVCEGYARAYQYLLKRAGIESRIVSSESMSHAWNLVKLNGEWYHVDVTWDDPVRTPQPGYVAHDYFLRSDAGFLRLSDNPPAEVHEGWTADIACTDERYETAFWQAYTESVLFLDHKGSWGMSAAYDEQEYMVVITLEFRDWASGAVIPKAVVKDRWYVWDDSGYFWTSAYTSLCCWYDSLYFNDSLHIYRYDPATDAAETVFAYDGSEGYFYGLRSEGDMLLASVSTAPDAEGTWYNSGLAPVLPSVCTYDAETQTVFVNAAFAGDSIVLCAGYDEGGRLLFVRILTPEESAVLPLAAAAVRVFRLNGGYGPVGKAVELTA